MSMIDREDPGPTYSDLLARIKRLEDEVARKEMVLWDVHAICNDYPHFFWWPVRRIKRFVRDALTAQEKTDGK